MKLTLDTAFDAIAGTYDQQFTYSPIGKLQRDRVNRYLQTLLAGKKNPFILDLGCGTGADAVWFARQNARVLALDRSTAMILISREKIVQAGLESRVTLVHQSMTDLGESLGNQKFDLIFSNFGALNCLSPLELEGLANAAAQHLAKHGQLIAVVMGSFCLWETAYFLLGLNYKKAFRRISRNPVRAHLGQSAYTDTWYYNPRQLHHLFSKYFTLNGFYPIGFFLPPSYFSGSRFLSNYWINQLARMERVAGDLQTLSFASDHYLIHMSLKH